MNGNDSTLQMKPVRYPSRSKFQTRLADVAAMAKWFVRRCPDRQPDIVKRRTVANFAAHFHLDTFVESGTYLGATVEFLSRYCQTVYSIEYQERLYQLAIQRFAGRPNIHILHGSGADLMPSVLKQIDRPALFWLDGHFASGTTAPGEVACPTIEELRAILLHRDDHVILIDDAGEFNGRAGYPALRDIEETVRSLQPGMDVVVARDIVRIAPSPTSLRPNTRTPSKLEPHLVSGSRTAKLPIENAQSLEDLKDYYKSSEPYKNHLVAKGAAFFRKYVCAVCSASNANDKILDLGCGVGQSTREITKFRKNVVGVDLSSRFLRGFPEKFEAPPMFAAADAAYLPFRNDSFDLVCSMEFIEHVWPVETVLREMIRVTAPRGSIIIASPSLISPLRPIFDLPGMLLQRTFRPPHYTNLRGAGRYFVKSIGLMVQKCFLRTPQFLYQQPDLHQADAGGDFDAVYRSHATDLRRFFQAEGLSVRFATSPLAWNCESLETRMAAALAGIWTSFIVIATKQQDGVHASHA